MGYENIKKFSKYKDIVEDGSLVDEFGEFIFEEMYEAVELIGKIHDGETSGLVETINSVREENYKLQKAYELINEDMKAKVIQNKELRKKLADRTSKYSQLANSHTRLMKALEDFVLEQDHLSGCVDDSQCQCMDREYYNKESCIDRAKKALCKMIEDGVNSREEL